MCEKKTSRISSDTRAKWQANIDQAKTQTEHLSQSIRYRRNLKNTALLIFCVFCCIGFGELITGSSSTILSYYMGDYDSKTAGTIISSSVLSGSKAGGATHHIRYQYEINGEELTSKQISFNANNSDTAYEVVKLYPLGKKVNVFYNSTYPKWSVLEKTSLSYWNWLQSISALCIGLLITLAFSRR